MALRKEKEIAQRYYDFAGIILLAIDPEQKVVNINRKGCEVTGYSKNEILGKNWFDLCIPQRISKDVKTVFSQLMKGEIEPVEYFENPIVTKGGDELIIAWHNTLTKDDRGNIISSFSFGYDITERKQAEEAIRKQALMIDQAYDSMISTDLDGNVTSWNNGAERMFGYTAEEALGKHISFVYPEDQHEVLQRDIIEPLRQKSIHEAEVKLRKKSGEIFYALLALSMLKAPDGTIIGMLGSAMDITKHKLAEEELRRHECIVSSSHDILALLDKNFIYLATNEAYLEPFGLDSSQVVGHNVSEVFGETFFKEIIEPNTKRCLAGDNVHYHGWFDFPVKGKRFMEVNYFPYKGEGSEIKGFVVNGRDITERKQAEDALNRSEQKYRSLIERTKDGVIITQNGIIKFVNNRMTEIVGYTANEMIDTSFLDYVYPDERPRILEIYKKRLQGEDIPDIYEMLAFHKNGEAISIETNSGIIAYEGKPATFSFIRDITERKRAETAIRESEEKYRNVISTSPDAIMVLDA